MYQMFSDPLQIFSSDAVNTGVGVYWMFYSGGNFEEAEVPAGFPMLEAGSSAEGLRYSHEDITLLRRSLKTLCYTFRSCNSSSYSL